MENSHNFTPQNIPTESNTFSVPRKLAEHLEAFAKFAGAARNEMSPDMKALVELTDRMALRAAEVKQNSL
jgi:hypothetical protein